VWSRVVALHAMPPLEGTDEPLSPTMDPFTGSRHLSNSSSARRYPMNGPSAGPAFSPGMSSGIPGG